MDFIKNRPLSNKITSENKVEKREFLPSKKIIRGYNTNRF